MALSQVPEPAPDNGALPDESFDGMIADLGETVRSLRLKRGLTIQELAAATGVSPSMVSTVERGRASPSMSTVHALAHALGTTMANLFLSENDNPVTRREDQAFRLTAGGVQRTVAAAHGSNGVEFWNDVYPAGTSHAPRPSRHPGWEYGLLLSGRLRVELENASYELLPGDSIQFRAEQLHLIRNVHDGETHAVWMNLRRF